MGATITNADPQLPILPTGPGLPLSYQERSWWQSEHSGRLGYQLDNGAEGSVNTSTTFRVVGELDMDALQQALDRLVQRQESLRTHFIITDGQPHRRVGGAVGVPMRQVDISHLQAAERDEELRRIATTAILNHFDYEREVLLGPWVIRLAANEHIVLLVVPHLVSDAVSLKTIMEETAVTYAHLVNGLQAPCEPLPLPYSAFVVSQYELVDRERARSIADYYATRFKGTRELIVKGRRPFSGQAPPRAAHVEFVLPKELTAQVLAQAKAFRVTPYIVLLSGFKALFALWSEQDDVLVHSHFSGRPEAYAGIVGLFAEICRLRTKLSGDPSFVEVVARVQEVVIEAFKYQWVPNAVLREVAASQGETLPPATVAMNSIPTDSSILPPEHRHLLDGKCDIRPYRLRLDDKAVQARTWCDLYLYTFIRSDTIGNRLVYRADLFEAETVRALTSAYIAVLQAAVANPRSRLSDFPRP